MNKRSFFLAAVLLALIALITHSVARHFLEDSMHRKAARIAQAQRQQAAYTPDLQALQSSRRYDILTTVGVVFTALSVVCMVTAMVRHEKGWYLILILLLFFDVVAPMLL
jgi:multisubunit Na+/H+ antiporter MnhG subunit